MSAIFVGRVISRVGEMDIGDEEPFIIPVYAVDVETSLKGEARGRIRLSVADTGLIEEVGGSRVAVGGRYLFFAAGPEGSDGSYAISEGFGSLEIDDEEAATTIALFEQWIIEVEQLATLEPMVDPCSSLTAPPTIAIDPHEGRAGTPVFVTATRVVGLEIGIWRESLRNRIGRGTVREDCTIHEQITIPSGARPGVYAIFIVDARSLRAEGMFQVIDERQTSTTAVWPRHPRQSHPARTLSQLSISAETSVHMVEAASCRRDR